ncbi:MAG: hypothetical protein JHC30_03995 [Caldisericum sp.]|nr:hypothetical protein [Caldisericum sp.]
MQKVVERFGNIEVTIEEAKRGYYVEWGKYVVKVGYPYNARMAVFALSQIENDLFEQGFIETMLDWKEEDWKLWDPYRTFEKAEYSIFHKDGYRIDLEVRMICLPKQNRFKVYVRGFLGVYVPLE